MIILRCDVCGDRFKARGIFTKGINTIVGIGEHELHGFRELIPQLKSPEVADVCANCFKKIMFKRSDVASEQTTGIFERVRQWIIEGCND